MKKLKISSDLSLPLDVITMATAILGIRGSGKTNTAGVWAEELLKHGQQVVVIDPLNGWWGLKSSADGKRPGYPVVVFGGNHADVPLAGTEGKALADFVVERRVPCVFSLRQYGVIEPLVVSADGLLFAGHRRRVASRVAYKQTGDKRYLTVPVVVNDTPPEEALELMLQENMQRKSLTPLEEARSMAGIKERRSFTTAAALARHLHLPPADVSQRLSILGLPPEVQALYHADELSLSAAPLLMRVSSAEKQVSYAGLLARRQLNLKDFRKLVEKDFAPLPPDSPPLAGEPPGPMQPFFRAKRKTHAGPVKKRENQYVRPTSGIREHPTRAEAAAALGRSLGKRVSLISVKSVLESVCCACGVSDQAEVCRTCPLPRMVLGIVGRAD
jgi:ParB/RepB/Spo0J family partition protein